MISRKGVSDLSVGEAFFGESIFAAVLDALLPGKVRGMESKGQPKAKGIRRSSTQSAGPSR